MESFNIHEAKSNLARLIESAQNGEPFVIAMAGNPIVEVRAIRPKERSPKRVGLLPELQVPADFDTMGNDHIESLFGLK